MTTVYRSRPRLILGSLVVDPNPVVYCGTCGLREGKGHWLGCNGADR